MSSEGYSVKENHLRSVLQSFPLAQALLSLRERLNETHLGAQEHADENLFLWHRHDILEVLRWSEEHDPLTGLLNRNGLQRLLGDSGLLTAPASEVRVMVLEIKDAHRLRKHLSFDEADRVILKLSESLRCEEASGRLLARTDTAQFTLCLWGDGTLARAQELFAQAQTLFFKALEAEGGDCDFELGAGTALFPEDGRSLSELLNRANMALERSVNGDDHEAFAFDSAEVKEYLEEYQLQKALRKAIEREELGVHYQPVFRSDTRSLQGFEALCRWNSPVFGLIPPGRFIPLAERDRMICVIGFWMLRTVCRQIRDWRARGYGDVCVSVNVSPIQLHQPDFTETLSHLLQEYEILGESIVLEITESTQLQSTEELFSKLRALRQAGVRISLDDFGTGYSSLAQLSSLPLNSLKVDRSFIWKLHENRSMLKAIVSMAQAIGLRTVAEGIETEEQLEALSEMGFDSYQGYWFGRPMSPSEAELFLRSKASVETSVMTQ